MASWQAHLLDLVLRLTVKRRLKGNTDLAKVRATLGKSALAGPKGVQFRADTLGGVAGEWAIMPGLAADAPVLLYLHGGGYFTCSPQTHRPISGFYARAGFRVWAPDYRLAPEHPFPAALQDAEAAYRALLEAGYSRITVSGDSAGGGLALALMVHLKDTHQPLPVGAALFCPWTDLAATGASVKENAGKDAMFWAPGITAGGAYYYGAESPAHPLVSPLYADLTGLPPLLIHVGAREILRDDSTRLVERARAAGVPVEFALWPVVPHVWQIAHRIVPEGRRSLQSACDFLKGKV